MIKIIGGSGAKVWARPETPLDQHTPSHFSKFHYHSECARREREASLRAENEVAAQMHLRLAQLHEAEAAKAQKG